MTAKNAQRAKQYPDNRAVVVDTLQGVLRAGGAEHTGMLGNMPLIKKDHAHAKHFKVGLENRPSQIPHIRKRQREKAQA